MRLIQRAMGSCSSGLQHHGVSLIRQRQLRQMTKVFAYAEEEVNMFRSVVTAALVFVAAGMASAQTGPQKPGPMDNLVATPNPATTPISPPLSHRGAIPSTPSL